MERNVIFLISIAVAATITTCASGANGATSTLPSCTLDTVYQGNWQYISEPERRDPDRWGFGRYNWKQCRESIEPGRWCWKVPEYIERMQTGVSYEWIPAHCHLEHTVPDRQFAEHILEAYRGKNIVVVGDSKAQELLFSMGCLFREKESIISAERMSVSTATYLSTKWFRMTSTTDLSIEYLRAYYFTARGRLKRRGNSESQNVQLIHTDRLESEARRIKRLDKADVVIVSYGSHYVANRTKIEGIGMATTHDELMELYRSSTRKYVQFVRKRFPDSVVVLRTVETAHYANGDFDTGGSCSQFETPIGLGKKVASHMPAPEFLPSNRIYLREREILKELVSEFHSPYVVLADEMQLFNGRPEAHLLWSKEGIQYEDCSHFCQRGIVDFSAVALLQALHTQMVQAQIW